VASGPAPRTGNDGIRMVIFRDTSWCKLDSSGICDPTTPYDQVLPALTNVFVSTSTGRIIDADIEVNAHTYRFADRVAHPELTSSYDLQNVLTHEFGHVLGLDSTCYPAGVTPRPTDNTGQPVADCATASAAVQATTMYPSTSPDDLQKRTLEPDDRAGVCAIYPAAASPCPAGGGSCACPPPGPDGGQDAGVSNDAGTNADAGTNTDGRPADAGRKSSGGGCSCETAGRSPERSWPVLVFLAVALVATRRSSRGPRPEVLTRTHLKTPSGSFEMSVLPEKTVEHSSQKALRGFLRCALVPHDGKAARNRCPGRHRLEQRDRLRARLLV